MTALSSALADASRLRATFLDPSGYALVYGSHAAGSAAGDSDLDLLFTGPPLADSRRDELAQAVVALHRTHSLRLDTEVAYDVKLHATRADVDAAVSLHGFTISAAGELRVTPVVATPSFLNSRPFKLRLILNALTTPHVFLGGQISRYQLDCDRAEHAAALLALSLLDTSAPFTVGDLVDALVTAPRGDTGKDFLGYGANPALFSTLQRGLTRLISEGVVTTSDGGSFRQDPAGCRALITRMRSASHERDPAGL